VVWTCRQKICKFYSNESRSDGESGQIARGRGRPRKIVRETIKKNLEINEFDRDMIYDRTFMRFYQTKIEHLCDSNLKFIFDFEQFFFCRLKHSAERNKRKRKQKLGSENII